MVMNHVPCHVTEGRWHVLHWTWWLNDNPWEVPLQVTINGLDKGFNSGLTNPHSNSYQVIVREDNSVRARYTRLSSLVSRSVKV
jgi:hypothetical protein